MTDDHTIVHQALANAGWTDLRKHPQRGNSWLGTDPNGNTSQSAPMLLHDPLRALTYLVESGAPVSVRFSGLDVKITNRGETTVHIDDSPMMALARAATLRLANLEGEQLELFK